MHAQSRRLALPQAVAWLSLVFGAALLLSGCGLTSVAQSKGRSAPSAGSYAGARVSPPVPRPEFVLTDTSGNAFDFQQQTQGRVTLLYFGYTHCPDVCPLQMASVSSALDKLPPGVASQVQVVFVTTDPARDTPDVLRHWLDHFSPKIVGLTGTPQQLDAVERQTGVPPADVEASDRGDYTVDHAAFVIAYTQDNLAHLIYPEGVSVDGWVRDLTRLVQSGPAGI